jgi:hypothetical protein
MSTQTSAVYCRHMPMYMNISIMEPALLPTTHKRQLQREGAEHAVHACCCRDLAGSCCRHTDVVHQSRHLAGVLRKVYDTNPGLLSSCLPASSLLGSKPSTSLPHEGQSRVCEMHDRQNVCWQLLTL